MIDSATRITAVEIRDVRVPTSDDMLGSDPFHRQPDYSSAVLSIHTNDGLLGTSIVFTVGAGTDWICYGIQDLTQLVIGTSLSEFAAAPITLYRRLIDHHQLRWLHDGVFRMAVGGVINAMWDLWATATNRPLWKLLVDLDPAFLVDCIDWRNIEDTLTRAEALQLLDQSRTACAAREQELLTNGPKAYCTAGWLGLSDQQILDNVCSLQDRGFDAFKIKVGRDLDDDLRRLKFMREAIGDQCALMVDANQYWSVPEAKWHMRHYEPFDLKWVEEPIARDDVLGYIELSKTFERSSFGLACGEHAASPVIFKQLLKSRAIYYCQLDAARVGGVNDLLAIILMAAKFNIPVCPHGGGIALCNMIQHLSIWDQIAVSGHSETQLVEYIDFLQEVVEKPVAIRNGRYCLPTALGWGLKFRPEFIERHTFPNGEAWRTRDESRKGARFEA